MASGTGVASSPVESGTSLVDKIGPHAPKILIGGAVLGLISVFLPAVTVSFLGFSETISVVRDWRGKLCLVGYISVGVMAAMMLKGDLATARKKVLACLITSGVVLLLAIWLPLTLSNITAADVVKTGSGIYVNIVAAAVLSGGAALQAKRRRRVLIRLGVTCNSSRLTRPAETRSGRRGTTWQARGHVPS